LERKLATFAVTNQVTKEVRNLSLVEGLSADHLAFVSREWTAMLTEVKDRILIAFRALPEGERTEDRWNERLGEFGAQDWDWNWEDKTKNKFTGSSYRALGIVDETSVEALMVLNLSWESRLDVANPVTSAYVEYVAVAPWNRRMIVPTPRFNGLGKVLLNIAVTVSLDEGMEGRCGLHSLPQAEGFYKRIGMHDLGLDADENLKYFEFSPEGAKKFLET